MWGGVTLCHAVTDSLAECGEGLPYVMQGLTHSLSVGEGFILCHVVTDSLAYYLKSYRDILHGLMLTVALALIARQLG